MINVVDAIMGAGKTTSAINYINESKDTNRFIYITPYLSEVDRIERECKFKQPVNYMGRMPKIYDLKRLLNAGQNVVTTHAMFHIFDDEVIDLCIAQNYTLIMDEVHDVVKVHNIGDDDLSNLLDRYVDVGEDGILHWRDEYNTYNDSKYIVEKRLCDLGALAMYGTDIIMWMFPVKVFSAFKEVYILTYMFGAQLQKYYYDYYGMQYKYMYVAPDYHFCEEPVEYVSKYDYHELINICEDAKLNDIGENETALSKTWYDRNKNNVLPEKLRNNIINFFNNKDVLYVEETGEYVRSASCNNLWTTFSDYKSLLAGKGYTKGFVASNMRATNEYRERTVVAYPINKYLNPMIKSFFVGHGVEVDEDAYAISEMVQFIWRSGIRDGRHITIYIPSRRMRTLLQAWMDMT